MNILFIQPDSSFLRNRDHHVGFIARLKSGMNLICPPLSFPMLAAVTPKKHTITLIDEKFQKINYLGDYDIIGITAMTNDIIRAYEIADKFREKGKKVVLGGCHVSSLPQEAEQHADSIVLGEAEEVWPQLLEDIENGCLKKRYMGKTPVNLDKLPPPNRQFIEGLVFFTGTQASRGCIYHCDYCYVGNSSHNPSYRKRSIENVIREIEKIPQKIIVFYDASLTIDLSYTKQLLIALKHLNKKFVFLGNIDVLNQNEEILHLAKEAGCIQWNIGFESVSQESINEVKKKTNIVKNYYKAVKKIHDNGMCVHGFFMVGFDNDTKNIFNKTLDFIDRAEIDSADFNILTPFPGTVLFDRLQQENRILTKDWTKYTYQKNVVFKPKNFSEEELLSEVKKIYNNFYSYSKIAQRFFNTIKRGIFNFHPVLFFVENILTKIWIQNL